MKTGRSEKAPPFRKGAPKRRCFCGGKAVLCADNYECGDPTVYYVSCSECSGRLMLGESSIAFKRPGTAIKVWDTARSGELING